MRKALIAAGVAAGSVLAVPAIPSAFAAGPVVYTVTNTSGDANVANSLPWAVKQANYATPHSFDRIRFNIPGGGEKTITINTTLYINDQVAIEGDSQPGFSGNPLIWIEGGASVPSLLLLQSDPSQNNNSSGSTVQGLGLVRYTSNAITIMPASQGNWIQYNWVGFRPGSGSVVLNTNTGLPNARTSRGVGIASSYNVVRFNTISGVDNGVTIGMPTRSGAPYRTNSIAGNKIGTDPTGTVVAGYGNLGDGIYLGEGASENWLGPDNVISGNASAGVEMFENDNIGNVVFRNFIGLDASGTQRLGNGELGVLLTRGADHNAIGGPFGGNYIAGNRYGGISVGQSTWGPANTSWIQDNFIGVNVNGVAVGGQQVGISINSGSKSILVEGNVIGGHTEHGVIVGDPSTRGSISNSISNNYIGRLQNGTSVANGGYGVMFLNAGYNWMLDNWFGANNLGPMGQVNSPGLVVRYR